MNARGFTLIEMMVVVVIMGLAASMVIMTFPSLGSGNDRNQAVQRFVAVVSSLKERSINEGRVFGLYVNGNEYDVMTLTSQQTVQASQSFSDTTELTVWKPYPLDLTGHDQESGYEFGENITAQLSVSGLKLDENANHSQDSASGQDSANQNPQIIFYPGGEVTAFKLQVASSDSKTSTTLEISETGSVQVEEIDQGRK